MAAKTAKQQPTRGPGKPFRKGASGNPSGRPQGSRHRASLMAEALIEAEGEEIVKTLITSAKGGDSVALRLCLERLAPVRKGRPIEFTLPPIETADDISTAFSAVFEQMTSGALSPDEAATISAVLELRRHALETSEVLTRLTAVEEKTERKR